MGYSPRGHKNARYDLVTKQTLITNTHPFVGSITSILILTECCSDAGNKIEKSATLYHVSSVA